MVAAGNPLGLTGFADIAREGLRYVNGRRVPAPGSWQTICASNSRSTPAPSMATSGKNLPIPQVAAQIATGSADAGMGIWSAAKMYQLDFIPVCIEQYDLLVPDQAWESPLLQHLLEILASGEFRRKLEELVVTR